MKEKLNEFSLHHNFAGKKIIAEEKDYVLLLEPIKELTWVILVPKVNDLRNILDLKDDQYIRYSLLVKNIADALNRKFKPDQVNIASLGNITDQLHFHIILRYKDDEFWPKAPFDLEKTKITSLDELDKKAKEIKLEIESLMINS